MYRISKHVRIHTKNTAHHHIFRSINVPLAVWCSLWVGVLFLPRLAKFYSEWFHFRSFRERDFNSARPTPSHQNLPWTRNSSCKLPDHALIFVSRFPLLGSTVLCIIFIPALLTSRPSVVSDASILLLVHWSSVICTTVHNHDALDGLDTEGPNVWSRLLAFSTGSRSSG